MTKETTQIPLQLTTERELPVHNLAKDAEGLKALTIWQERGCRGTLEVCTGTGKTKMGLDAASALIWKMVENNLIPKVLIIVPTEELRDSEWMKEAIKWEVEFLFTEGFMETVCIQSAYKWTGETYDLVVVDEIDTTLSPEYIKFYSQNTCKRILGLTATVPDEKRTLLSTIAPVVHTITTAEAKVKELVANYRLFNVPIGLTAEETRQYQVYNDNIDESSKILAGNPNENIFGLAQLYIRNPRADAVKRREAFVYMKAVRDRLYLTHGALHKITTTRDIVKALKPKKCIIFSESIEVAEHIGRALNCLVYHSKMDRVRRKLNLAWFNDPASNYTTLSTVKALDRGINIEATELIIIASGSSKPYQFTQRLGRGLRLTEDDNKITICINLYAEGTKEMDRVAKRCENDTPTWLPSVQALFKTVKPFHE